MGELEETDEMKEREVFFYIALLLGLLYLLIGKEDWSLSFGVMWVFLAFFNAMRYRYRKHDFDWWGPELLEGLTLIAFVAPGSIIGLAFLYPLGIAIGSISASRRPSPVWKA